MHRNRSDITHRLHIPDLPEKLLLCKNPVRILSQKGQKIKLLGSKRRLLTIDPHTPGRLIDLNTTDLDHIILMHIGTNQPVITLHMRLQTCNQLTWAERLGHIIIRTKSKSTDLIDVILLRGNHDDRRIFLLTDLSANIETVHLRKHQIQNDQIKILLHGTYKTCITTVLDLHFKPRKLQIILLKIRNRFLILYDQNSTHSAVPPDIF